MEIIREIQLPQEEILPTEQEIRLILEIIALRQEAQLQVLNELQNQEQLIRIRQEVILLRQEVTARHLQEVILVLQEILLPLLGILAPAHHELQNLETMAVKVLALELMKEAELELTVAVEKETPVEEEDKSTTL